MIDCLLKEISQQKQLLEDATINTIYFGGGTPSLLTTKEITAILQKIKNNFNVNPKAEITLEANPDDLTKENTASLFSVGINRLSIGTQTYQEDILKSLNRSHDQRQAIDCIENARLVGFKSINIDLIFGLPRSTDASFREDVAILLSQNPEHISAYWLTIEDKTVFGKWIKKGTFSALSDEKALQQWDYLKIALKKAGYIQYEISNFAKPTHESNHNSNYWKGVYYLGLGPSAHSFDGKKRTWNISNNNKYIQAIENNTAYQTTETLTREDKINEHIMTRLRTIWGIDLGFLKKELQFDLIKIQQKIINQHLATDEISIKDNKITLTNKGQQFADQIASNLFV